MGVSSPFDRSDLFTPCLLPGRPVHSDTNSASPGSILATLRLRLKTKSLTFPPLSIARYSFKQLSQLPKSHNDCLKVMQLQLTNKQKASLISFYGLGTLNRTPAFEAGLTNSHTHFHSYSETPGLGLVCPRVWLPSRLYRFHSVSRPVSLHGWTVPTPGKHTLQLSNIALEQTTWLWLEWLPILRFLVCGCSCFLFRLSFWSSRYALYTTTFGPVWRQDKPGGCSGLGSHRSSWCWAVCHIHDSAGGRGWLAYLSDSHGAGLWCSTPTDRLELRSVFPRSVQCPCSV